MLAFAYKQIELIKPILFVSLLKTHQIKYQISLKSIHKIWFLKPFLSYLPNNYIHSLPPSPLCRTQSTIFFPWLSPPYKSVSTIPLGLCKLKYLSF
jgi:hypothetical protein